MRMIAPILMILMAITACVAAADSPVSRGNASGREPVAAPGGRDVCWSEPGDLNGFLGSSEIISQFGLESEIANDFTAGEGLITKAIWWAGEYNPSIPCQQTWPTPGFNLRFYEDASCRPGTIIADLSITDFDEEFVTCPNGWDLAFKYTVDVAVEVVPNALYWFGAQVKDHPFPGQGGRLTSVAVVGCEACGKSAYFGFPDWTPSSVIWSSPYDFGQEFECTQATAAKPTTWGGVKAIYR